MAGQYSEFVCSECGRRTASSTKKEGNVCVSCLRKAGLLPVVSGRFNSKYFSFVCERCGRKTVTTEGKSDTICLSCLKNPTGL